MLFLVIRTKTAAASQRALEVSLGVTRLVTAHLYRNDTDVRYRHREGLGDLHQYVIEEDPVRAKPVMQQPQKGPKVINLDDRYASPIVVMNKERKLILDLPLYQLPNRNGPDHLISPFTSRQLNYPI